MRKHHSIIQNLYELLAKLSEKQQSIDRDLAQFEE